MTRSRSLLVHTRCLCTLAGPVLVACGSGDASSSPGERGAGADAEPEAIAPVPPGPDILLGAFDSDFDEARVSELENVTRRPGYDNQPAFLPDGTGLLFTRVDSTGQADIWRYDLRLESAERVTTTALESEYSAAPLPDASDFGVVRVEADSAQRLWRIGPGPGGGGDVVLFPDLEPVGYYAWAGDDWVAAFVLGDPPTLRVADVETRRSREVARNIGRSVRRIPGAEAVSFVQRPTTGSEEDVPSRVMRWSVRGGVEEIAEARPGGDDHAWTPDGILLMGEGSDLWGWHVDWGEWRLVGSAPGGAVISRIAVSDQGDRIALVVEPPSEP